MVLSLLFSLLFLGIDAEPVFITIHDIYILPRELYVNNFFFSILTKASQLTETIFLKGHFTRIPLSESVANSIKRKEHNKPPTINTVEIKL